MRQRGPLTPDVHCQFASVLGPSNQKVRRPRRRVPPRMGACVESPAACQLFRFTHSKDDAILAGRLPRSVAAKMIFFCSLVGPIRSASYRHNSTFNAQSVAPCCILSAFPFGDLDLMQ